MFDAKMNSKTHNKMTLCSSALGGGSCWAGSLFQNFGRSEVLYKPQRALHSASLGLILFRDLSSIGCEGMSEQGSLSLMG